MIESPARAYSKVGLRVIRIDEAGGRFSLGPPPGGFGFRQKLQGGFNSPQKIPRRKSAVGADGNKKISHPWGIFLFREIFGLVGLNNPVSHEFEPMITFSLKIR